MINFCTHKTKIDAMLGAEMTRWGRSTQDLMDTLGQLASWDVSLIAQTGLTFDMSTPQGKLITNLMTSLARPGGRPSGADLATGRQKGRPLE